VDVATPDGVGGTIIASNDGLVSVSAFGKETYAGRGVFIAYEGKNASHVNWIQFATVTILAILNNRTKLVKEPTFRETVQGISQPFTRHPGRSH
jgi:hypothetical protein